MRLFYSPKNLGAPGLDLETGEAMSPCLFLIQSRAWTN